MKREGLALRPEDVAREMGMSATQIRNLMRAGAFDPPIGYAYRIAPTRYQYVIYRPMLDKHLGIDSRDDAADILAEIAALVRAGQEDGAALRRLLEQAIGKEEIKRNEAIDS